MLIKEVLHVKTEHPKEQAKTRDLNFVLCAMQNDLVIDDSDYNDEDDQS